jgi:hypothetical protein
MEALNQLKSVQKTPAEEEEQLDEYGVSTIIENVFTKS